jgi:hypothetical protein
MVLTFQSGRTSAGGDPKIGRRSISTDDDDVEKVRAAIRENSRVIVREVSEKVGITRNSCHTILTEKLELHSVALKFVPRLLTDEQKAYRVTVNPEPFHRSNAEENIVKKMS